MNDVQKTKRVNFFKETILPNLKLRFLISEFDGPMYRIRLKDNYFLDYYPKGQRGFLKGLSQKPKWIDLPLEKFNSKIIELTK